MVIAILFLLLLIGAGILWYLLTREQETVPVERIEVVKDTIAPVTIAVITDTIKVEQPAIPKKPPVPRDTTPVTADTVTAVIARDTIAYDPCREDTIPPWVYPDPSGGLHYGKASVQLKADVPCFIEWKFKDEQQWRPYDGGPIRITQDNDLCFRAKDSCGNSMDARCERYEIRPAPTGRCPEGMEYIKVGGAEFCIDRYEWPNKKGRKPLSYISLYQAIDSCFVQEKRLCTSDEWSLACGGVYSWKYAYGDTYEPHACNTRDTSVNPSGSCPECRGYFGVFDMSGNLAEWTNTRSNKNKEFYNVMGGFWESGPQSNCFDPRYSYYPQNRHNPVGFRCCKDVNKTEP